MVVMLRLSHAVTEAGHGVQATSDGRGRDRPRPRSSSSGWTRADFLEVSGDLVEGAGLPWQPVGGLQCQHVNI